jgi:hypothetical protein
MLTKRSLRVLIVANLILIAVSVVVGIVGEAWLPEPLRAFEQTRAEADMTPNDWVLVCVGIPLLITVLVASIGLLAFWRPARPLYFVTIVVATLLTPLGGPYITLGWAQALDGVSFIVTGVVLAAIYFSPLRELYDRPHHAA